MSSNNNSTRDGRIVWISLFAVLAIGLLAVAAFVGGSRLNAETAQANARISSAASGARYGNSLGVAAVRAADAAISSRPASAARYGSSPSVAAVRAADAAASSRRSLRGVAAVRAIDRAEIAPISLRIGAESQGLSNLELWRSRSQTSAVRANDASAARYTAMGAAYGARAATAALRASNAADTRYAAISLFYGAKN